MTWDEIVLKHEEVFITIEVVLIFLLLLFYILKIFKRPPRKKIVNENEIKDYSLTSQKRFQNALIKTRSKIFSKMQPLFDKKGVEDKNFYEELEEALISADIGVTTTNDIIDEMQQNLKRASIDEKFLWLKNYLLQLFVSIPTNKQSHTDLTIIMVVGVNGVGKTTTIGKLASHYTKNNKKVVLAAADTFRAAAIEQLTEWAQRSNAKIIKHQHGADPSAVVYDAVEHAIKSSADILIIDTAGRLHTKKNLMEELKKIKRTAQKHIADAPHETLLVLDATTGQNALEQAKLFNEALQINSIIMTKLDGTAKGGILIRIASELQIPVSFVGLGESIDALQQFNSDYFIDSLLVLPE